MSPTAYRGPLYRPRPAEIDALCDRLRAEGLIGDGPGDALRLATVLIRLPPQPLGRLGDVIVAVLRTEPDRTLIDEVVRPWLRRLAPVVEVSRDDMGNDIGDGIDGINDGIKDTPDAMPDATKDTPSLKRRFTPFALVVSLLGFALVPILSASPPAPDWPSRIQITIAPLPSPPPDLGPMLPPPPPAVGIPAPIDPAERAPLPRDPTVRLTWTLTAALALLLALLAARLRDRLAMPDPPRAPVAYAPPSPPAHRLDPTPRLIPREAAHRLTAGSGRAVPDPDARAFDAPATVRATAARMGHIPAIRFRPRLCPEAIELWVDSKARHQPTLARALAELTTALARSATPWHHRALLPAGLLVDDRGARHTPDDLPLDPDTVRIALLTNGAALLKAHGPARATLIRRLRRWPHLAIVRFGGDDPARLAAHLDHAVPVLGPDDLVPWLVAIERRPPAPLDLAALRTWAAALALAPLSPDDADAFDLRTDLVPTLPPTAIDALPTEPGHPDRRGPMRHRAGLITWLRTRDPQTFETARRWWRERLSAEPRPYHEARPDREARIALLDLWTDPEAAARRLAASGLGAAALFDPLAYLVPLGHARDGAIELPWRWSTLTPECRDTLRRLGLGAAIPGLALASERRSWPLAGRAALAMAAGLLVAAAIGTWHAPPSFERLAETIARPAMVPIAAGRFVMGSRPGEPKRFDDEIRRPVTLTRAFWMAETEVTQAQYTAVIGHNPSAFSGEPGDGARPVETVSWLDAVRYCNALSAREGLAPAYAIDDIDATVDPDADGYRLPTEAEWEYAARAGTTTATYAGELHIIGENNAPVLDAIAWYGGNSGSMHPKASDSADWSEKQHPHERSSTQPVKGKRPNAWGLYDMLGNVGEWVGDWHDANPARPLRSRERVLRGASFGGLAHGLRAASRSPGRPDHATLYFGFRPVRSAPRVW